MRIAILSAMILLLAASHALAQSGRTTPLPPRASGAPEIISSPPLQETPQQRVLRLEAELNQARQAAVTALPPTGPVPPATVQPSPAPPTVAPPTVIVDESWRYRQVNGTWWYLQPNNRWAYWSHGHWVEYVPHVHVAPRYYPHHDYEYHRPSIGITFGHGGYHGYGHH